MIRRSCVQLLSSVILMSGPFGWPVAGGPHLRPGAAPLAAAPVRDVRVTGKLAGFGADDLVCESATLTTDVRTFFDSEIEPNGKTCAILFKAVELSGTLELEVRGTGGDVILTDRTPVSGKRAVRSISWWPRTLFGRKSIDLGSVSLKSDVLPGTDKVTLEVSIDTLNPFHGATCQDTRLIVDDNPSSARVGKVVPGEAVILICTVTFRDVPIPSSIEVRITATQGGSAKHASADFSSGSEWWRKARDGVVQEKMRLQSGSIDLPNGSAPGLGNSLDPPTNPGSPPEVPPEAPPDDGSADEAAAPPAATPAASAPCTLFEEGDINCDGVVDRRDITDALKAIMGLASSVDADVNRDGVVDEADMEEIRADVEAWLEENRP